MTQQRDKKGLFLPNNGIRYRQSDIDAAYMAGLNANENRIKEISDAFIAGLNDKGGLSLPSQKLKNYLEKIIVK